MNDLEVNDGDLAADLRSAFAGTNETAPPDAPDKTETSAKTERARDEAGRFATTESGKGAPAKDQPAAKTDHDKLAEPGKTAAVSPAGEPGKPNVAPLADSKPAPLQPPKSWSIPVREKFASLDPEVQQEILKREQDIFKGIEQYQEGHRYAQSIQRTLQPYMATIQSLGVTPDIAIQQLLSVDHSLRYGSPETKVQTLAQIAQSFGIDVKTLATEQPPVDPTVAALRQELNHLKQHLNTQQSQTQTAEQQHVQSEIEQFAADPQHAYFDDVRQHMGSLMSLGQAKDLQDAYEQACWSNPQIRAILLRQQDDVAEKARLAEAAKKADAAKRAGFDVQGSGATQTASRELTLEDELRQQFNSQ